MKSLQTKITLYLIIGMTCAVGWSSLIAIWLFFHLGSFNLINLSMNEIFLLVLDALLCLAFFIQHSGMIRRRFRCWAENILPADYQGVLYTLASGIILLALVLFWQKSNYTIIIFQGPLRWLMHGVFLLSLAGIAWSTLALGSFDALGLDPIRARLRKSHSTPMPLTVRGPYLWVRHPLYTFSLLSIWSCPDITVDRLMFNILWTGWIIVGTVFEERDLVADFGQEYRDYQHKIPMLIPRRIPSTSNRK